MIKPISPNEVVGYKSTTVIPQYVIEAFNYLISKNFKNNQSIVKQQDVVLRILQTDSVKRMKIDAKYLFENNFLDVEDIYREAGWVVEYDKPAYCETYEATFKFTKKEK